MLLYWDGYEIDGSDTTYDLVVPVKETLVELVEYYLSLPLWDRNAKIYFNHKGTEDWAPHRCGLTGQMKLNDTPVISTTIRSSEWNGKACIVTKCLLPERLPEDLKAEVYNLSKTRPQTEEALNKAPNPAATLDEAWLELHVGLQIDTTPTPRELLINFTGMVLNREALVKQIENKSRFTAHVTCGPSIFYEYAAYIVTKIAARFPGIGISGGLDCEGGFLDGCTYHCSLYQYDRIKIPVKESIESVIDILFKAGLIRFPRVKKGEPWYPWKDTGKLQLTLLGELDHLQQIAQEQNNSSLVELVTKIKKSKYQLNLKTYGALIKAQLSLHSYSAQDMVLHSACYVEMAKNEALAKNERFHAVLKKYTGSIDVETDGEWPYKGFLTTAKSGQEISLEILVDWRLAPCFRELFSLCLDFD